MNWYLALLLLSFLKTRVRTKMMMTMMRMAMMGIPTWIMVAVEGRTET